MTLQEVDNKFDLYLRSNSANPYTPQRFWEYEIIDKKKSNGKKELYLTHNDANAKRNVFLFRGKPSSLLNTTYFTEKQIVAYAVEKLNNGK